jgi:hypothetical protein
VYLQKALWMQFPKEHFQIILYHYDNVVDAWS